MGFDVNSLLSCNVLQNIVLPADGEDEESLQGHVLGMDKEMQKSSPNVAYITDSLARTFPTRRLWVTSLNPSVAEIVEKYPALKCGTFVSILGV